MTSKTSIKMELKDILTKEWFEKTEAVFLSRYDLPLEICRSDSRAVLSRSSSPCDPHFCGLIRYSCAGMARCRKNRLRWMNIAAKTGKPHINICHAGIVLACVPIVYRQTRLGGIFFGKCLCKKPDKSLRLEFRKRFKGFRFNWHDLNRASGKLRVVPERRLVKAAEFLQSQLKRVLVPKKVAILRQQKAQWQANLDRKQKQRQAALPNVGKSVRLQPAVEYMDVEYDRQIKLKDIARFAGLSIFRFAHLFREQTGMTPVDYLTYVRIHHAKRLLLTTDWSGTQVSCAVGYRHQSYFIRTFKRITGTTPERFRLRRGHK
jgi:AraC-like DNA-binding protein/ligand-binding sensor protein